MKSRLGVALVALVLVAGLGCTPEIVEPPAVTVSDEPREDRAVAPTPPEDPTPEVVWPLTGMIAEGVPGADLGRPAVAVKIENTADGRPQKGLEYADIVFDEYINAGCLRLVAVFHSTLPEAVGPVRSARNQDPNIMGSFDTPIFSSGANRGVQETFNGLEQVLFGNALYTYNDYLRFSHGFTRKSWEEVNKPLEFRLWGNTQVFAEEAEEAGAGPAPQQFDYAYPAALATAAVEGEPVATMDLEYSACGHPHWDWNAESGVWDRFEFSDRHVTMDGTPIQAANVVILRVDVAYTQRKIPESFVVVSDAPGFVATHGAVQPILWTKSSRTGGYILETLDGDPVLLAPGQTWIELVPLSGAWDKATITFDGEVQ